MNKFKKKILREIKNYLKENKASAKEITNHLNSLDIGFNTGVTTHEIAGILRNNTNIFNKEMIGKRNYYSLKGDLVE